MTLSFPAVPPPTPKVPLTEELVVLNNPVRDRYELYVGGELIGVEGYELTSDGRLVLLHTVVMEKFGEQGFARALVDAVLRDAASQGRGVIPVCTYVRRFLDRYPDYAVLVAADQHRVGSRAS